MLTAVRNVQRPHELTATKRAGALSLKDVVLVAKEVADVKAWVEASYNSLPPRGHAVPKLASLAFGHPPSEASKLAEVRHVLKLFCKELVDAHIAEDFTRLAVQAYVVLWRLDLPCGCRPNSPNYLLASSPKLARLRRCFEEQWCAVRHLEVLDTVGKAFSLLPREGVTDVLA